MDGEMDGEIRTTVGSAGGNGGSAARAAALGRRIHEWANTMKPHDAHMQAVEDVVATIGLVLPISERARLYGHAGIAADLAEQSMFAPTATLMRDTARYAEHLERAARCGSPLSRYYAAALFAAAVGEWYEHATFLVAINAEMSAGRGRELDLWDELDAKRPRSRPPRST